MVEFDKTRLQNEHLKHKIGPTNKDRLKSLLFDKLVITIITLKPEMITKK